MKSYLLSVLSWIIGSCIIIILFTWFPYVGKESKTGMIYLSIILSLILGPVGDFYLSYILNKLNLRTLNPFITTLISCLIFLAITIIFWQLIEYNYNPVLFSFFLFVWILVWVIIGPIIVLNIFLRKKKQENKENTIGSYISSYIDSYLIPYLISVFGWILGLFTGTILLMSTLIILWMIFPYDATSPEPPGSNFAAAVGTVWIPLAFILGPVGNFLGSYFMKKLNLYPKTPFIPSLISSTICLFFLLLADIINETSPTNHFANNLSGYFIGLWLVFWLILAPALTLISFVYRRYYKIKKEE